MLTPLRTNTPPGENYAPFRQLCEHIAAERTARNMPPMANPRNLHWHLNRYKVPCLQYKRRRYYHIRAAIDATLGPEQQHPQELPENATWRTLRQLTPLVHDLRQQLGIPPISGSKAISAQLGRKKVPFKRIGR